jgi:hypothetical protein
VYCCDYLCFLFLDGEEGGLQSIRGPSSRALLLDCVRVFSWGWYLTFRRSVLPACSLQEFVIQSKSKKNADTSLTSVEGTRKVVDIGQMAVPQLSRLVDAFHPGGPGSSPCQVLWNLFWTKWHWVRLSPSTSVFPVTQSTDCSTRIIIIIIIIMSCIVRGWFNRPNGCRRSKWTQSHFTPSN